MKISNIIAALRDQLPLSRLWRNIRNGNIRGLFHARAHLTYDGSPKIAYGSKASAEKAARKMQEKYGHYYSNYRCMRCSGYHLGKNQQK